MIVVEVKELSTSCPSFSSLSLHSNSSTMFSRAAFSAARSASRQFSTAASSAPRFSKVTAAAVGGAAALTAVSAPVLLQGPKTIGESMK